MTEVIGRLAVAVNARDLDAVAGLIHRDYRSEQPTHPGRAFAGRAFEMRGVTLFEVTGGQIVAGRLYLEDVEQDVVSIEQAVEDLSGRRPRPARQ
jgi:hypothetical protein